MMIDQQNIELLLKSASAGGILQNSGYLDGPALYNLSMTAKINQLDARTLLTLIEQEFTQHHPFKEESPDLKAIKAYYAKLVRYYDIAKWLTRGIHLKDVSLGTARAAFMIASQEGLEVMLHKILKMIPHNHELKSTLTKAIFETNVLQSAVFSDNKSVVSMILDVIPENKRSKVVLAKDNDKETILHKASYFSIKEHITSTLLAAIPEEQQLNAVLVKNSKGETALHKAAHLGNGSIFSTLLAAIPEEQRLVAVLAKDSKGRTALHMAVRLDNGQAISDLLATIPNEQRLDAVLAKDSEESKEFYLFYRLVASLNETISHYQKQRNRFFGMRASQARQKAIGLLQQQMDILEFEMLLAGRIPSVDALKQLQAAVTTIKQQTLQDHQQSATLKIGSHVLTQSGFAAALAKIEQAHGFSSNNELPADPPADLSRNRL